MKRLIPSAFIAMGLVAGGTCQIARAQQVQGDQRPYTDARSDYGDQRTYHRGSYGNWGLLGLCGLFGLLGGRRTRTYDTTTRRVEGTWEPRPTH
jgi:hypothetical protein